MIKNAVFHLGAHKTATSSIQQSLRQSGLRQKGVLVIAKGAANKGRDLYKEMVNPLIRNSYTAQDIEALSSAVVDVITALSKRHRCDSVILSDENLGGPMPGLSPLFYDDGPRILSSILDKLKPEAFTVFLTCRKQDDFLCSCYRQLYHLGKPQLLEEFLESFHPGRADWNAIADKYVSAIGRDGFRLLPYEAATGSFVPFFQDQLCRIGIDVKLADKHANISVDHQKVAKQLLAKDGLSQEEARSIAMLAQPTSRQSGFPPIIARAIMGPLEAGNRRLFRKHLREYRGHKLGYYQANNLDLIKAFRLPAFPIEESNILNYK
ncbi:hypothetical protein FIU93_22605 [Labrenzia sp. THAF35]|uniref:hypothetical protein n=1 Tax=Labrenzia sp. THAF35 TaxID=2587854 RepID=UPI001268FA98|nr:hypothetical protein [Labrenzia sp. THAF35]QFT69594.1 hypothetical protein FIU93_22605 [Labrenzia sp. THAF35]